MIELPQERPAVEIRQAAPDRPTPPPPEVARDREAEADAELARCMRSQSFRKKIRQNVAKIDTKKLLADVRPEETDLA